jgi:hypothetical protein
VVRLASVARGQQRSQQPKAVVAMPTISVPRDALFEAMGQKFTEDEFQEVRACPPYRPCALALGDSAIAAKNSRGE